MQIKDINDQIRNDLFGTLKCEHCGHEQRFVGYNDDNYYNRVVPSIKCQNCGKTSTIE